MSFSVYCGARAMPGLPVFINLDGDGYCWRDGDSGLPETHATRRLARRDANQCWRERREAYRQAGQLAHLRGEHADETFAGTLQADGSVLLADGATVIPATPNY